jgi:hypothetical protein
MSLQSKKIKGISVTINYLKRSSVICIIRACFSLIPKRSKPFTIGFSYFLGTSQNQNYLEIWEYNKEQYTDKTCENVPTLSEQNREI